MTIALFPQIALSTTEEHIVAEKLADPAVKKYIQKLAHELAVQMMIYNEPGEEESAESFLRKRANMQGQLAALNMFASIENPAIPQAKKE